MGEHQFLPYIVNMPILFETFVAAWLRENVPPELQVTPHYRVRLDANVNLIFDMDIVVANKATGRVLAILDTKYKRSAQPDEADINQVTAYALQMDAPRAILIYPSTETHRMEGRIRDISLQSLVFDISRNDLGGDVFLNELLNAIT